MKYARQRDTAARLISKYGQPVQVYRVQDENVDWMPGAETITTYDTNAVFFTITKERYETARLSGYELTGSVYAMCPAFGYIPKPGDSVFRSGVKLVVEYTDALAVNGEIVYVEIYLKGDVPASITVL